jgi:predicted  nucleic acid-binding Zn-ribbon protein
VWHHVAMADQLAELGEEFQRVRRRQAQLRRETAAIVERKEKLRLLLAPVIAEALQEGRSVTEVVKLTGYTRDNVLKIRKAVERLEQVSKTG